MNKDTVKDQLIISLEDYKAKINNYKRLEKKYMIKNNERAIKTCIENIVFCNEQIITLNILIKGL